MSTPTDRLVGAIGWLTRNRLDPSKGEYLANWLWHREHEQDAQRDRYRRALEAIRDRAGAGADGVATVSLQDLADFAAEALKEPTP